MSIDALPPAPAATDPVDTFDLKAFAFNAALQLFCTQANATADSMQTNADILAAVLLGMALPEYAGTSATSLAISTGSKTFVTQTGKRWTVGQIVVVSNGANLMRGPVTAYSGSSLTVNVTSITGSGTFSSWSIGLSFDGLLLARSGANSDITALLNASGIQLATRQDVASASTVSLNSVPDDIQITGTTTITGFTVPIGRVLRVRFAGSLTLTNSAGLVTQTGANVTTRAGDTCILRATAANTVEVLSYAQVARPTLGTSVATTSGSAVDFTAIPSWVNRITVMFNGVSTTGSSSVVVQLGTAGGVETAGYVTSNSLITSAAVSSTGTSGGFAITATGAHVPASVLNGVMEITRITGNSWVCRGSVARTDASFMNLVAGAKDLPSALDRIRIATSDTFDAGVVNILFE